MNKLYYVFNTEVDAIAAEKQITILGNAPILGRNALTGKIEETIGKTICWDTPKERLDGKWVFRKVSDTLIAKFSDDIINEFNTNFPNTLEEYNPTWFKTEEKIEYDPTWFQTKEKEENN